MKKFILILSMLLFTSCCVSNNSDKETKRELEKKEELEYFINMKIGDYWSYYTSTQVYRIYGGWIVSKDGSKFNYSGIMFIPYDDFMKEYNIYKK